MKQRDLAVFAVMLGIAYVVLKARNAQAQSLPATTGGPVTNPDGSTTLTVNGQTVTLPPGLSPEDPLVQQMLDGGSSGGPVTGGATPITSTHGGGVTW